MLVYLFFLLWSLTHNVIGFHSCNPNGQFYMNGLLCQCNSDGTWSEDNCRPTYKRRICSPGHITFKDCSRCVCQSNGQYLCSYNGCDQQNSPNNFNARKTETNVLLDIIGTSCIPFKSYYVNCHICFCPPSGSANKAQCSRDDTCTMSSAVPSAKALMKNSCVPKLIYSYPCLQCPCSDQGRFDTGKCVNTCSEKKLLPLLPVQCTPKSFYKIKCNVCFCPTNGIPDPKYCSKKQCSDDYTNSKTLRQDDVLQATPECTPYTFTEKRCFYCTCNPGAIVNENHCLEVECELIEENEYTAVCTPDEMYPICAECYCYRANLMDIAYCTKRCSQDNKASIFKKVLNDCTSKVELLESSEIQDIANKSQCEPNALFKSNNRTCLCPETGIVNQQYCGFAGSVNELPKEKQLLYKDVYRVNITFNASCTPSTFITIDCNLCFCTRDGKIDPKWCTYDDCETLQKIQDSRDNPKLDETEGDTCTPGIVSRIDCNLCLCPLSGLAKDRICSKNPCNPATAVITNLKLDILCKPSTYYKVECNICLCPKDGVKNLESCSKNNCERNALRTLECEPGKLFSDECNICICAVSGSINDRICTNNTCSFGVNADTNVLASSQQLLDQFEAYTDHSRTLDPCFPEEEFVQGCKLCICPDMGLKQYATCTTMLCDASQNDNNVTLKDRVTWQRCSSYNVDIITKEQCVPGGIYAEMCKQCLCPEKGSTENFCRDMPKEYNCSNVLHVKTFTYGLVKQDEVDLQNVFIKHEHTLLPCAIPGKVVEKCRVCDCESHEYSYVMVEEHCFKSDDIACANVTNKGAVVVGNVALSSDIVK